MKWLTLIIYKISYPAQEVEKIFTIFLLSLIWIARNSNILHTPQTVRHHSAHARKATHSSKGQHTPLVAPRNYSHIQTHHKQSSASKVRAARSRVQLVVHRDSLPDHRKATTQVKSVTRRHRKGNEVNKRRHSQMLEVNRTRNVLQSVAVPTDPSPIQVCMSEFHCFMTHSTQKKKQISFLGMMLHHSLTAIKMIWSTLRQRRRLADHKPEPAWTRRQRQPMMNPSGIWKDGIQRLRKWFSSWRKRRKNDKRSSMVSHRQFAASNQSTSN